MISQGEFKANIFRSFRMEKSSESWR